MRKFSYWVCRQERDAECYHIRARTKREAARQREACDFDDGKQRYSPPFKVTLEFSDTFDLVDQLTGEGGAYEYPTRPGDKRRFDAWKKKRRIYG